MKSRPAARLLIIDDRQRLLLFRFCHRHDALAGQTYWATPGGAVEKGETFPQAACRELWEETGIVRSDVGACIGKRRFPMRLPDGSEVIAEERFFVVRVNSTELSEANRSEHEQRVISKSAWWSPEALQQSKETIYPENIALMLEGYI